MHQSSCHAECTFFPLKKLFSAHFAFGKQSRLGVLFFEKEFHWKVWRRVSLVFRTWVNTPWSLQNISCRPLLQDSENNTHEAFHGGLNTFPLVGSEWKYIYRRRLMLCAVFLDAVFLHRADAGPHTAGYWARMCWILWVLTSCAFLLWKGLTRVKGQNTAFEQVLNFRTGDHKKKNSPWKDFIFYWNLRKLNCMEMLVTSVHRTQQHPALSWSFSSSRTLQFFSVNLKVAFGPDSTCCIHITYWCTE